MGRRLCWEGLRICVYGFAGFFARGWFDDHVHVTVSSNGRVKKYQVEVEIPDNVDDDCDVDDNCNAKKNKNSVRDKMMLPAPSSNNTLAMMRNANNDNSEAIVDEEPADGCSGCGNGAILESIHAKTAEVSNATVSTVDTPITATTTTTTTTATNDEAASGVNNEATTSGVKRSITAAADAGAMVGAAEAAPTMAAAAMEDIAADVWMDVK